MFNNIKLILFIFIIIISLLLSSCATHKKIKKYDNKRKRILQIEVNYSKH